MKELRGKSALVTGAASGIGRALALELAREGMRLYLLDVNAAGLATAAADARRLGVEIVACHCDLRRPPQIADTVQQLLREWGGLQVLVNNAGLTYYGRTTEMSAEHWNELFAVNIHAPVQLTRELLPTLLANDESHILNVASVCGLMGLPRVAAYTTTKFALVGLSQALRAEFGRCGLGVTALCPGFVDTGLFAHAPLGPDLKEPKVPPRWMLASPERIARSAVRAIYRNRQVVTPQLGWRALDIFHRIAPGLFDLASRVRFKRRKPPRAAPSGDKQRRAA